jgi:hypothetical protein
MLTSERVIEHEHGMCRSVDQIRPVIIALPILILNAMYHCARTMHSTIWHLRLSCMVEVSLSSNQSPDAGPDIHATSVEATTMWF